MPCIYLHHNYSYLNRATIDVLYVYESDFVPWEKTNFSVANGDVVIVDVHKGSTFAPFPI